MVISLSMMGVLYAHFPDESELLYACEVDADGDGVADQEIWAVYVETDPAAGDFKGEWMLTADSGLSDSEVAALPSYYKKWRDISVPCDHTDLLAEHSPDGISDADGFDPAGLGAGCIEYDPTPGDDLDGKGLVSEGHIEVAASYTIAAGEKQEVTICWPDGGKIFLSLSVDGSQHSYQEGSHDRIGIHGQAWTRAYHGCQIFDTIECLPYQSETVSKTPTGVTHQMTFYRYIDAHADYGNGYTPHHINDLLPVTVEWEVEDLYEGTDPNKEIDPLSYDAKSADEKPCSDPNSSCYQESKRD